MIAETRQPYARPHLRGICRYTVGIFIVLAAGYLLTSMALAQPQGTAIYHTQVSEGQFHLGEQETLRIYAELGDVKDRGMYAPAADNKGYPVEDNDAIEASVPSTMHTLWRGTDPTTSMSIQWLSEDKSPRSVGLARSSDGRKLKAKQSEVVVFGEPGDVHRHRVDYTGLAQATRYEIILDGSATRLYLKTAPATLNQALTFVQGGDVAVGEDVVPLHRTAVRHDPLFALLGGDMADSEPPIEPGAPDWTEFFENWHDGMRTDDGRLIPIVAAIGNHEIDDNIATQYLKLFDNTRRKEAYWTFDIGDYFSAFILDNELHPEQQIPGAEKQWFAKALEARRDVPHTFAIMHEPPYTAVKSRKQKRGRLVREHWVPLFEKYKVDVVFQDDDELYARTYPLLDGERDPNGIIYAGNGGWGEYDDRKVGGEMQGPEADGEMTDREMERALAQFAVTKEANYVLRVTIHPDGSQSYLAFNTEGIVDRYERGAD